MKVASIRYMSAYYLCYCSYQLGVCRKQAASNLARRVFGCEKGVFCKKCRGLIFCPLSCNWIFDIALWSLSVLFYGRAVDTSIEGLGHWRFVIVTIDLVGLIWGLWNVDIRVEVITWINVAQLYTTYSEFVLDSFKTTARPISKLVCPVKLCHSLTSGIMSIEIDDTMTFQKR